MSDIALELESGKTATFKTAGKVCKDNIVVTATGGDGNNGHDLEDALVERTIKHYENSRVTKIGTYAFYFATTLEKVNFPNVEVFVGSNHFNGCTALEEINFPKLQDAGANAFKSCSALTEAIFPSYSSQKGAPFFDGCVSLIKVDLGGVLSMSGINFNNCKSLEALIIRNLDKICVLSRAFPENTSIASGTGYIYVPRALIEEYKVATNWVTYASQFRAIEDYPEICGGVEE